jgi:predicted nuclease of restriction endonuclease-like (RecB) superfamily
VTKELMNLYWDIGRMIVERQKGRSWGKSVVRLLSEDLHATYPGVRGFSVQNLWYMRQLYQIYQNRPKLQPLVGEISWSHNLVILMKCKEDHQREYYLRMTCKFGWSKRVLVHQIENQSFEKTMLSSTNFDQILPEPVSTQAKLAVLPVDISTIIRFRGRIQGPCAALIRD